MATVGAVPESVALNSRPCVSVMPSVRKYAGEAAMPETPFLQIGETKYGKPIMDRITQYDIPLARAAKGALISFDSTMRSNLSVGLPIDMLCYRTDSLKIGSRVTIRENDPYFSNIRKRYGKGLYELFGRLPEPDWVG